jgi:AcrR family transcriptional regulator
MSHDARESLLRPGRKRDPEVGARIVLAAVETYARDGWTGFTFESVARQAKVGKPAIYLRWDTREDLLADSLETISLDIVAVDTGGLRSDLHEWVLRSMRMQVDQVSHPELRTPYRTHVVIPLVESARGIVDRAIARGQLDSTVDGNILLEVLNGGVFSRLVYTPVDQRERLLEDADEYANRLITLALEGAATPLRDLAE